ncbi:hypothetical protein IQ17_02014 [Bradyrhizobium daqingense]|jgi:hypothetical protein|uniref:Uncharacterized protein n=2 Tax=Bradyrhizobium TaxID=374 RepID=A0A562S4G8_9BRAD|nr:hypothetical protein IQ17_02014 [Bradyrhizobium daqingense]TWI76201.1 hypothetical protein IQ16_00436 [Bradyrhizobium huanghuaihaiense]
MVAPARPPRDRSRIRRARLGQVLLKALLPGLAGVRLFRDVVLHLRPSCYVGWIKVLPVHASLTSKIT